MLAGQHLSGQTDKIITYLMNNITEILDKQQVKDINLAEWLNGFKQEIKDIAKLSSLEAVKDSFEQELAEIHDIEKQLKASETEKAVLKEIEKIISLTITTIKDIFRICRG